MQRTRLSKGFAILTAIFLLFSCMIADLPHMQRISAAGVNYPAVFLRVSSADNSKHINIAGTGDKSGCVPAELKNSHNENWHFDYVGTNTNGAYYKITNYNDANMALTYDTAANSITLSAYSGATSQKWLLNAAPRYQYHSQKPDRRPRQENAHTDTTIKTTPDVQSGVVRMVQITIRQ